MLIYQYSGGLDGFLTAVFYAYEQRQMPDFITDGEMMQPPLSAKTVFITPDEGKALRVERGIADRLGDGGLHQISYGYASQDPEKNRKLFYWVLSVFKYGKDIQKRYQDPNVMDFYDMTARVTLEIHRMLGFLRFRQSEEGLYYGEFAPDNNIVAFLMPHFVRRFQDQSFIIRDCRRGLYGIYNGSEWKVIFCEENISVNPSEPEVLFAALWKEYFRAVSIASRENNKLRDAYLPRRYRAYLPEFHS